jgi:hypothetical protein
LAKIDVATTRKFLGQTGKIDTVLFAVASDEILAAYQRMLA